MTQANITQVQQLLQHQLEWLWAQPELACQIPPLMLWGAPGVGKSAVIRDLCKALGIGFIDVRLAQREPVDLRGLPVPDNDQVRWLLSSEWPRNPDSRGIILFDELTAADRTLQVAAYEFILDRRLGDLYRVPPGWLVCAAGNRSEDRAVAMTLSSALANRFCHLELAPDLAQWTTWAGQQGLHPDVRAFLRFRPQHFFDMQGNLERGWPSPRSWERVALALESPRPLPPELLALLIEGLVGPGPAIEFLAFRRMSQLLPDVPKMLDGSLPLSQPEAADARYALGTALAHHVFRGPPAERGTWIANFLQLGLLMSTDFAVMTMTDTLRQLQRPELAACGALLFGSPLYEQWMARHGAGLSLAGTAPPSNAATAPVLQDSLRGALRAQRRRGAP